MNLNSINTVTTPNSSFGCDCDKCKQELHVKLPTQQPDMVEISGKEELPKENALKKGFRFIKNNRKQIVVCTKAAVNGLLTACTILGANQLMQKVSSADTSKLAAKLAIIGGIATSGTTLIQNRKVLNKTAENNK